MDSQYEKVNLHPDFPAMIYYFCKETMENNPQINSIPSHWHRSLELSYVKKGSVDLYVNHKKEVIHEGEFICVNSAMIHEIKNNGNQDCEVMMVIISYSFLKKICKDFETHLFHVSKENIAYDQFVEIYEKLIELFLNKSAYYELSVNACLYQIVYLLMKYCIIDEKNLDMDAFKMHKHEIIDYIEEHYSEDLSLKQLAMICSMSEEHFSRSFQKTYGINFKKFLTEYRLFQSYEDVINTDLSVQTIALRHGFSNTKSFINEFKKVYHETPYKYRKTYQKMTK